VQLGLLFVGNGQVAEFLPGDGEMHKPQTIEPRRLLHRKIAA
jgi:hypothetical protein